MKINLILQESPSIPDYTNKSTREFRELENSVCTDIMIDGTLEYLNNDYFPLVLKKLRYGGKVTIIGSELNSVIRAYELGNIQLEQFNGFIAGGRIQTMPVSLLLEKIKAAGLNVMTVSLQNLKYYVTAERPLPNKI